jgi:hypothetical protein
MQLCSYRRTGLALLFAFCIFCFTKTVAAQTTTADVVGTVSDATGSVLPGATVTITNLGTNISQTVTTGSTGDYVFTLLQVGPYTVKVEAKGFKTYVAPNIALSGGDRARIDAKLEVGDVTQTVEVSGAVAPALQTDTATIGALVTSQAVEDVPLDGRNVTKLVQLAPGVNQGSPNDLMSGARPDDRRQTAAFSANGQADAVNNLTIDGIDNNDAIIGTTIVRPSVDAIQEVNVQTNMYDASLSRTAGAIVDVISKSGSNSFHGSGYEFFRNAVLNTNPNHAFPSGYCAANSTSCTPGALLLTPVLGKPAFRQNQYGASLGGPIKKDKTFFFGDFEQLRKGFGIPITATVPSWCETGISACPDGRTQWGDFSDQQDVSQIGGSTSTCTPSQASATCPFVSVSPSAVTPLGLEYFLLYPKATNGASTNNYTSNPSQIQNSSTFDARVDQHFSDSDTLFVRYSFNDVSTLTPDAFPAVNPSTIIPAAVKAAQPTLTLPNVTLQPSGLTGSNNFAGTSKIRAQGLALSYVHVFSANFILNLKAGYSRLDDVVTSLNAGSKPVATEIGFPACGSVSCVNFSGSSSGIPNITTTGPNGNALTTLIGDATFLPIIYDDNTFQYNANFTWNKNAHSVRFGAVLIRRREAQGQSSNGEGGFAFTGAYSGVQTGDMLLGDASSMTRSYALIWPNERQWQPGAFFQDDWRATHWLTVNLGTRYDIFAPLTEKYSRISNWNPATGLMSGPGIPGINQTGPTALLRTQYGNIVPRIGFAATLKHDMVIRGGFGISYFQNRAAIFKNAPYNYSFTCTAQNQIGTNNTCAAFGNSATVQFGLPTSNTGSLVGSPAPGSGMGGSALAAGTPTPVLNPAQVLLPANCPTGTTQPTSVNGCSAITQTNPNGNPYASISIGSTWPNYTTPYLEQFNMELQKAWKGNVLHIGYVGELGRHNGGTIPFTTLNNYLISQQVSTLKEGNPLAAQYPWLSHNTVSATANIGTTSYNALLLQFQRRFSNGLTVNANYTWDQSLANDNAPCHAVYSPADFGYGTGAKYINPCFFDNVKNPQQPISVTSLVDGPGQVGHPFIYNPNRLAGSVNYELPFVKNAKGIVHAVAGGWAVNAAGYWQSGLAFNLTNGSALGAVSGTVVGGGLDQVCSGRQSNPTLEHWINPGCFVQPTGDTYGTSDFNQMLGPRQRNLDFSLFKEFTLTERVKMQFRAEVFNLLNVVNYEVPGFTSQSGNGAISTSIPTFTTTAGKTGSTVGACGTGPSGVVFAGTCGSGLLRVPGSTGLDVGAVTALNPNSNSREVQFGLKFLF